MSADSLSIGGGTVTDIKDIENNRKRLLFLLCCGLFIPLLGGFAIINYFEGDTLEMLVVLCLLGLMILALPAVLLLKREVMIYRVTLISICLAALVGVAIGAGNETILYWIMIVPLVLFFFMEKREGILLVTIFALALMVFLFGGESLGTHAYALSTSGRFVVVFLFIVFISYGLEASRYRAARLVLAQNVELAQEKERLEHAMTEIKTLSGLLPICASCKKVRADSGYWHQIEEYITEHSEARFSHGICPDCIERLYPGLSSDEEEALDEPS